MRRAESASWVAVVDDHAPIRDVLTRLLRVHGISVESFSSAEEYLRLGDSGQPCCLVLDVSLPGMSGLALHQELAARHSSPPPIIFISALDDIVFANVIKTGVVGFLQKPFEVDDLIALVRPHLTNGAADALASIASPVNSAN